MILLSFMMVYVITGIVMINHDLLTMPEVKVSHSTIPVEKPMMGDPEDYAKYLKDTLDLKGRTQFWQDNKDNWIFNINIPGDGYQIKAYACSGYIIYSAFQPGQDILHGIAPYPCFTGI